MVLNAVEGGPAWKAGIQVCCLSTPSTLDSPSVLSRQASKWLQVKSYMKPICGLAVQGCLQLPARCSVSGLVGETAD